MTAREEKFDHGKVEAVGQRQQGSDIGLDLPIEKVEGKDLPAVTIITVTRNRRRFFPLAIDNWKRVYYPHDKLTWLVVDDSDDIKEGPVLELKALKDPRILYYYLAPKKEGETLVPYTIGYKRNYAIGLAQTDIVTNMDDDDFFYGESILHRVCAMVCHGKQHVYSHELGIYNVHKELSYILEDFDDVPEGTQLFTKKFWEERKYGEGKIGGEGVQLVRGREIQSLKIPWYFNMVVLNHRTNTTGKGRDMRFPNTGKMKTRQSLQGALNLWKTALTDSFKKALKELK